MPYEIHKHSQVCNTKASTCLNELGEAGWCIMNPAESRTTESRNPADLSNTAGALAAKARESRKAAQELESHEFRAPAESHSAGA